MASACSFDSGKKESETRVSTGPSTSTTEVDIHSSLEGMAELPRHLRWTATISLPAEQIKDVRFLVDRTTFWIDAEPPYSYGEEGAFLATRYFYSPYSDKEGQSGHRFTVRVNGMEGVWREHVVARVQKPRIAKRAPTYGIWGRLPPDAVTNPRPTGEFGPYTAWLYMVGGALWVGRTVEHAYIYELAAADPRRFRIGVPIFMGSHDQAGGKQGWFFKGYQCAPAGPPATYALSWTERFGAFNERHLVLTARHEPCAKRRGILEGVWELLD
jgi:hypothetical protein